MLSEFVSGLVPDPITREVFITIGLFITVVVGSYFVGFLWKNVFRKIAGKTPTKLDVVLFEQTEKPVIMALLVGGLYYTFWRLGTQFPGSSVLKISNKVFFVLAIFTGAYFLVALVRAVSTWYLEEVAAKTDTTLDEQFALMFGKLSRVVIYGIAAMMILSHFKVDITGLVATAGVASLAVAFAAQESIANLFAGLTIMMDKPFRKGDRVELADGQMGDVREIGLRSTKILTFDNTLIVVPNSEIAKSCVINYSYPTQKFKIRQTIGVAYGSDIDKVKEVLTGISKDHQKILDVPEPQVFFTEFADSSLNFMLVCWIQDYRDKFSIQDEINMAINRRFIEENIEIPFPQRDVHIYNAARE